METFESRFARGVLSTVATTALAFTGVSGIYGVLQQRRWYARTWRVTLDRAREALALLAEMAALVIVSCEILDRAPDRDALAESFQLRPDEKECFDALGEAEHWIVASLTRPLLDETRQAESEADTVEDAWRHAQLKAWGEALERDLQAPPYDSDVIFGERAIVDNPTLPTVNVAPTPVADAVMDRASRLPPLVAPRSERVARAISDLDAYIADDEIAAAALTAVSDLAARVRDLTANASAPFPPPKPAHGEYLSGLRDHAEFATRASRQHMVLCGLLGSIREVLIQLNKAANALGIVRPETGLNSTETFRLWAGYSFRDRDKQEEKETEEENKLRRP